MISCIIYHHPLSPLARGPHVVCGRRESERVSSELSEMLRSQLELRDQLAHASPVSSELRDLRSLIEEERRSAWAVLFDEVSKCFHHLFITFSSFLDDVQGFRAVFDGLRGVLRPFSGIFMHFRRALAARGCRSEELEKSPQANKMQILEAGMADLRRELQACQEALNQSSEALEKP